jgi:DHA1 family multidrug resistance protein-like MFS transporter
MFNNLGVQWAGTLLGCLATVMVPIPVVFYFYGHKIRGWSKNPGTEETHDSQSNLREDPEKDEEIMGA